MVVTVSLELPPGEWRLGRAVDLPDGTRAEYERVVPTGETAPYLWVEEAGASHVEWGLREHDELAEVVTLSTEGGWRLFGLTWTESTDGFLAMLRAADGALVAATGTAEGWYLNLRFPSETTLSRFHDMVSERGTSFSIRKVSKNRVVTGNRDLTTKQREILQFALDAGYFDVPRRASLRDIAEEFEISDTAASQRLQRGMTHVLRSSLQGGRRTG